ncbi:PREDICTED: uncharacterized protein LOC105854458 isoform X4 [Condylura cristata]|uniref:uncharacterized protein LOC105854458 isoform X4 n=1 Tax=Condylura cristata TaxID=143302 RepID=UPI0006429372|nr:PREDICTED: uncharacterized protein LOC105854458 isoform X4 [Condylura cristata]
MALLVPTALVALTILRAPAWACLLCFTTSNQRYDVCRALVFWPWDRGKCQKSLENAFQHLQHLDIRYEDRPELQKEFLDTLDDLKKWPRRSKLKLSPYQHPFDGAAQAMQEIMKLKPAPKCIPPCGKVTIPTRGLQGSREVVEWHPGIPSGKVRVGLLNPERPVKALEKTKPGPGPPPGGCQCQSKVIGPWPVRETWEGSCPRLGRAAGPACAPTGLQEQIRYYSCQECTPLTCNLPLDCPGCDGDSGSPGPVLVHRQLHAAPQGRHLYLEVRGRGPDAAADVLPGLGAQRRQRGADPAGAAFAPRNLQLLDL